MTAWAPPEWVGEFRLKRALGAGATAQVWEAWDSLLERQVALKFGDGHVRPEVRLRFLVEARAIARLHHPNVVAVHHVGQVGDRPFLVTELLTGRSLADAPKPVAPERALAMAVDLARGLAAVHALGIVHRDVKPANTFECEGGVVKLLDFGLAKVAGETDVPVEPEASAMVEQPIEEVGPFDATADGPGLVTMPGTLVGTPLYMAPEAWRGETTTGRSDVYSLGVLIFELITGRTPRSGASLELLRKAVLEGTAPMLSESAPGVPLALAIIIDRCLARDPAARPTSEELREALEALTERRRAGVTTEAAENPYRGLLAFGAEHRGLFFGREPEIRAVLAELRSAPFVLVVGPSGTGKSSLVRAGVAPRVEEGALGPGPWRVASLIPGRNPIDALAQAVAPLLGASEVEGAKVLAWDPGWAARGLRQRSERTLLVVDQLEELMTLSDRHQADVFVDALADLSRTPSVRMVATLRSDFLGRLAELGTLRAEALRATVVLGPMTREGLRAAIVEPARRQGAAFESESLVDGLVAAAGDALPLLQFALAALWDRRAGDGRTLTRASLEALGGLEGALATYADTLLGRMAPPLRAEARRLLVKLVTVERTRARVDEGELAGRPDARSAMDALVAGRLVVAGHGDEGVTYEVAHEALITGWPTLAGWLDEEEAARTAAERLRVAVGEWERLGRGESGLFGERQLRELAPLAESGIAPRERAFLAASRAGVRRAWRRRWALRLGVPAAALVALVATIAGLRWRDARETRRFVEARLADAAPIAADAAVLDEQAAAARGRALALFDRNEAGDAERTWSEARALAARASARYSQASGLVDAALARDPLDDAAHARAADLTHRWLLAAERDRDRLLAAELRARLEQIAPAAAAALQAPVRLTATSVPPADLELIAIAVDSQGRRVERPLRRLAAGETVELPPGSYLIQASLAGRYPTRYPVLLGRGMEARVEVVLPRREDVPAGMIYVPAGEGLFGEIDDATRMLYQTQPEHPVWVDAFLIAEHEVTFGEYLAWLDTLPPDERRKRRPVAANGRFELVYLPGGTTEGEVGGPIMRWPRFGGVSTRPGEPLCLPARKVRACQDWLRLPVAGIDWHDATAYAEWLAGSAWLPGARLCSEREWERAARGADGRRFAHGDALLPGDANVAATWGSRADQVGLDEAGSYPLDVSPFGVRDTNGNVREWVADSIDDPELAVFRGGTFTSAADAASTRDPWPREGRLLVFGTRICAPAPPP